MSANEQSSKAAPSNQEPVYPPPVVAYTPSFNGATYPTPPPPGPYPPPPFFAYPPPPQDGSHGENGPNGAPPPGPYMIPFPPGMVYAFPPPQGQVPVPPGAPVGSLTALTKPKRKQVKMACTNCAAACKRCDEGRPCERCQKYGIGESCRDGQRKERKKGIKRGPYKRKNKNGEEWTPATAQPAAATTSSAPIPVPQFASPEGYYGPIYYPTPGAFLPHPPHEVPAGQEGSVPTSGQPPVMPYFLPYPSYPPYGHPAMYPGAIQPGAPPPPSQAQQPQQVQPQQTVKQASSNGSTEAATESPASGAKKKKEDTGLANGHGATENAASAAGSSAGVGSASGTTATTKKRTRGGKSGDSKSKKAKSVRNGKEREGGGKGSDG